MNRLWILLLAVLIAAACGGGGGGGGTVTPNATLVGRVLSVQTGGPISPAATVQVGSANVQTQADGSFSLSVPGGSTSATVSAGSFGAFTFSFAAASGTVDLGDLWVGPQKVTVTGRILDAADSAPIEGATVTFAGKSARTNAVGTFRLTEVAYSSTTQTAFWGIRGSASAAGYFRTDWSTQPNLSVGGTVTVNDVLMTRTSSDTPPPPPSNLYGRVAPAADANGAVATLKLGTVNQRIYNVAADGFYYFWIGPGTYTVEIRKGTKTGTATVTLSQANERKRQDVTLN